MPAHLVIVGSGIAGTAAALEAAAAGVDFVVVEQEERFGGTAARGGLGCSIAGSPMQRLLGIEDTPEQAVADLTRGQTETDLEWAHFYYRSSVRGVYYWLTDLGVTFETIAASEGDSVPRFHVPHGLGERVMSLAWKRVRSLGLEQRWRLGSKVTDFIWTGSRGSGVRVSDSQGALHDIEGGAVVLATGGFAANLDRMRAANPQFAALPRLLAGGGPNAKGDGHDLALRAGGYLTHERYIYGYANGTPDYTDPSGRRGVVVRYGGSWIWVNSNGQRFINEDRTQAGRTATARLMQQEGATCWAIVDDRALESLIVFDHYQVGASETRGEAACRYLANSPYARTASSCAELASLIGVSPHALEKTIAEWRNLLDSGVSQDPLTGRMLATLRPLGDGAWHAIQFFPLGRKTLGGVRTDLQGRVVTSAGEIVPGLFAAGELAGFGGGNLSGSNSLEGVMAGGSLFSGRIAGRCAALHVLDPDRKPAASLSPQN